MVRGRIQLLVSYDLTNFDAHTILYLGSSIANRADAMQQEHYGATRVAFELAGLGRGIERQQGVEPRREFLDDDDDDTDDSVLWPRI